MSVLDAAIAATPSQAGADKSFKVANLQAGEARFELSNQWFSRPDDERFLNLADLAEHTRNRFEASREATISNRDLEFIAPDPSTYESMADKHKLSVGLPDGTVGQFTNWAFGQAASLAGAPASYLRTLPGYLAAENLSVGLMVNREREDVKAFYQPAGDGMVQAFTGPDYGRIADYKVVEAVRGFAGDGMGEAGWKVPGVMNWSTMRYDPMHEVNKDTTTLFASDRDVFLFLVDDLHPIEIGKLPNGDPDLMFRGFYVWNSEVGSKSLGIATMYLRAICCNRILWGVEHFSELKIRHSKYAADRFVHEAAPALASFAKGHTRKIEEGIREAQAAKVAKDDDEALAFLKGRGFSKARSKEILAVHEVEEFRPARSAWDMAQGITAFARTIPHQDARLDVEQVAGNILNRVAA